MCLLGCVRWPITATAIERSTVKKRFSIIKKVLLSYKKGLLSTKKKFVYKEKIFVYIEKKVSLHTYNKPTTNSYSK